MLKRYVVKNPNTNPLNRNLFIWLFIVLFGLFIFNIYYKPKKAYDMVIFSDFIEAVQSNNIISVTIQGKNIIGTYKNGKEFKSYAADDPELVKMLREHGIRINAKPEEDSGMWQNIFISWFPMLLLIAVWIFFMRQMQSGGGKAMAFGKSKARLFTNKDNKVTFQDVAGVEEAKEELEEVIEFLVDPKKFTKLGGRIPKGVLLVGPPGTGKTLLARAIAGEANVPFFSISGSDLSRCL